MLIGSSTHALQVAGIIPINSVDFIPKFKPLGLYSSGETIVPQAIVLLIAIAVVIRTNLSVEADNSAVKLEAGG